MTRMVWGIRVKGKERRKKSAEGGGWHEVLHPTLRVSLPLPQIWQREEREVARSLSPCWIISNDFLGLGQHVALLFLTCVPFISLLFFPLALSFHRVTNSCHVHCLCRIREKGVTPALDILSLLLETSATAIPGIPIISIASLCQERHFIALFRCCSKVIGENSSLKLFFSREDVDLTVQVVAQTSNIC